MQEDRRNCWKCSARALWGASPQLITAENSTAIKLAQLYTVSLRVSITNMLRKNYMQCLPRRTNKEDLLQYLPYLVPQTLHIGKPRHDLRYTRVHLS
jgi:hypothetical protein